jgi:hypothetical protein
LCPFLICPIPTTRSRHPVLPDLMTKETTITNNFAILCHVRCVCVSVRPGCHYSLLHLKVHEKVTLWNQFCECFRQISRFSSLSLLQCSYMSLTVALNNLYIHSKALKQ